MKKIHSFALATVLVAVLAISPLASAQVYSWDTQLRGSAHDVSVLTRQQAEQVNQMKFELGINGQTVGAAAMTFTSRTQQYFVRASASNPYVCNVSTVVPNQPTDPTSVRVTAAASNLGTATASCSARGYHAGAPNPIISPCPGNPASGIPVKKGTPAEKDLYDPNWPIGYTGN